MIHYYICSFEVPGFELRQTDTLGFDNDDNVVNFPVYACDNTTAGNFTGYAVTKIKPVNTHFQTSNDKD